jgi:hypothetical protein
MSFLPKGYETPQSQSQYMKLEDGENRIRILGEYDKGTLAVGWEYWLPSDESEYGKPVRRVKKDDELKEQALTDSRYKKKKINHFWAFPVYDYKSEEVKWLSISQVSIQRQIELLVEDEDWGKPIGYDIKIIRETDDRTSYTVKPVPHKPLSDEIKAKYKALTVNKDEWMNGGHPFSDNNESKSDEIDLNEIPDFDA